MLGTPIPTLFGVGLHVLGVYVFFALSGYLISSSLERDGNPIRFLMKRTLRLLPALWVCLTLTMIVFAATSSLGVGQFLSSEVTRSFLWNYLLNPRFSLPGVFDTNPWPSAVHGSIWSLPAEAAAYIGLLALSVLGRAGAAIGLALAIAAKLLLPQEIDELVFWGTRIDSVYDLAVFFAAGACLSAYRTTLKQSDSIAVCGLVLAAFATGTSLGQWALMAALPYAIVTFGAHGSRAGDWVSRFGDLSYGTYLYAFPVQQTLILAGIASPGLLSIVSAPIVLLLAALSWHLVEKPVMRLKPQPLSRPPTKLNAEPQANVVA